MKNSMFLLPLAGLLALVGVAVWALLAPRNLQAPPSQLIGRPAPDLTADPLAEVPYVAANPGMVRVVNFWASYCVPCIHEHGQLVAIAEDPEVHVTGVTFNDPPEGSRGFLARYGNPFDRVLEDRSSTDAIAWGVNAIPTTFVVSANGTVVYRHDGAINAPELTKVLGIIEGAKN